MAAGKEIAKQPGKKEENALPPSIFWGQALLYDIFANTKSNLGTTIDYTRKVGTDAVVITPQSEANKINTLANVRRDNVEKFIDKITPLEVAQIVPKINFSLVDANTLRTINIPLTNPTDLKSYAGGGYFQGGVVGLKSVDLTLDGSANPAFARHYLVDMSFVFDSINTFTSLIPGQDKLTFDEVFRTQGRAVSDAGLFYRLGISYDGSKGVMDKYNLSNPDFTTTLNLTPIKSEIQIEENLKVTLKINFTSIEESVIEDNDLFDFLRLDLATAIGEKKRQAKDAKDAYEAAKKANEEQKNKLNEGLEETINNVKLEAIQKGLGSFEEVQAKKKQLYDKYASKAQGNNPSDEAILEAIKADKINKDQTEIEAFHGYDRKKEELLNLETAITVATTFGEQDTKEYKELVSKANKLKEEVRVRDERIKQAIEDEKNFRKLKEHVDDVTRDIERSKRTAEMEKTILDETAKNALRDAKRLADEIFNSIRATQISRVLTEAIYDPGTETGAIKEISVALEDIRNYFSGGLSKELIEGKVKPVASKDKGPAPEPAPRKDGSDPNEPGEDRMPAAEREQLIKEEAALKVSIETIQDVLVNQKKRKEDTSGSEKALKEQQSKLSDVQSRLARTNRFKIPGQNGGTIGDAASIFDKYSQRKVIKYILLGDLVSLLVNRLKSTIPKGKNSKRLMSLLQRCVILLSKMNVPVAGSKDTREQLTYNIPIDLAELELILSKKLFGKAKNTYTLFELIEDVVNLINITKQHISKKFGEYQSFGSYDISIRTYSLQGSSPNYEIMKIAPSASSKTASYKLGFVLDLVRKGDGFFKSSDLNLTPKFYFGGVGKGAMKKIGIKEISDSSLQKAAFEKIKNNTNKIFVPAFFENTVTLIGCPIFHLGMYYELAAPTIKSNKKNSGWFFIEGLYSVKSVKHSYSAGGSFTTVVTGMMASPKNSPEKENKEPSKEATKSVKNQLAGGGTNGSREAAAAAALDAAENRAAGKVKNPNPSQSIA